MATEYPRKEKRNIWVLASLEQVEVLSFSPDPEHFMIMQDEIYRLGQKFGIYISKLLNSGCIEDNAYHPNGSYFTIPQHQEWRRCVRFYATYEIKKVGKDKEDIGVFFGSGSAGSDNVASWQFKGSAYEIAHKRAKVNGIRQALGLFEYKIEGMEDTEKPLVTNQPVMSEPTYEKSTPEDVVVDNKIMPMQVTAVISIIKKMSGDAATNKDYIDKIKSNACKIIEFGSPENLETVRMLDVYEQSEAHINAYLELVAAYLSKQEAVKVIKQFGNFSHEAKKP